MPILVCGINHKTAPIDLREKVVFSPEKLSLYLQDLVTEENLSDAMLLSTCNRSELYCVTENTSKMAEWYSRQHAVAPEILQEAMYFHEDEAAVEHIMSVACGLDSMVLGESQILGQMKDAFSEAVACGSISTTFNRLFQQVFTVAKEVRTNTAIGGCPVSVSSAALHFIKRIFPKALSNANILLLGAGATVELVLKHLTNETPQQIWIANRTRKNAETLAEKYQAKAITFSVLPKKLSEVDIIISATGGAQPVITQDMIPVRKNPLLMLDLAVPRNIEPVISEIENVFLYSIDDLKNIIQKNLQGREHAAEKAREVIKKKSGDFIHWLQSLDMVATTIRAYRKQIEDLSQIELMKARKQLERGDDPHQVISMFAHALTNKLLHAPSVQLRQAGFEGRLEILQFAKQLFAIPELESEIL
jgi:glutamyl-tRNA reductase